jgi:hypothetical protein
LLGHLGQQDQPGGLLGEKAQLHVGFGLRALEWVWGPPTVT